MLAVLVVLFSTMLMSTTASASKTCWDNYYHTHPISATGYDTHYVYMTGNEGGGEWVYWKKSRYEYGSPNNYQDVYYGATYC